MTLRSAIARRLLPAGCTLALLAIAAAPVVAQPLRSAPAADWTDAPLTRGNWRWRGREAAYGPPGAPAFIVRCEENRRIALVRTGAGRGTLVLRTSAGERRAPAIAYDEGLIARVDAGEPLLDALIFSRGRFAVESPGSERLIVPTWPEPARVIDDCRR